MPIIKEFLKAAGSHMNRFSKSHWKDSDEFLKNLLTLSAFKYSSNFTVKALAAFSEIGRIRKHFKDVVQR